MKNAFSSVLNHHVAVTFCLKMRQKRPAFGVRSTQMLIKIYNTHAAITLSLYFNHLFRAGPGL